MTVISKQIHHPLRPLTTLTAFDHESKLGLRLTIPILGKLIFFFTKDVSKTFYLLFLIKMILGFIFFESLYSNFLLKDNNFKINFLFVLNISSLYIGYSYAYGTIFFDEIAFFLIYFSATTQLKWIQFSLIFLAIFTDERAVFSAFLLILINYAHFNNMGKFRIYIYSIGFSLIVRQILGSTYELFPKINNGGITLFQLIREMRITEIIWGMFSGFKLMWIYIILYLFNKDLKLNKFLFAIQIIAVTFYCAMCLSVIDVTRSVSYLFPLLLVPFLIRGIPPSVNIFKITISTEALLLLNLLIPNAYIQSGVHSTLNLGVKFLAHLLKINPI
jgi:hypothetical protein